jgi:transcriptional regulator with XRE-family HTH domain
MASETLGAALKRLREARGWSQRDLAAKALVTGAYVAMIEGGAQRRASVAVLRRFERALKTPYGALAGLAHLPQEWWRPEAERELTDAALLRTGPYFAARVEAEQEARRQRLPFVARYQDKSGAMIRRAFPVRRGGADGGGGA